MKFAFYGKGGIGKSTVSSNVSSFLADKEYKVVHIGCDPKHDSTRLLLNGADPYTITEYLVSHTDDNSSIEDVYKVNKNGVMCFEVGGPKPGFGCAGRGIISALDFLGKKGIDDKSADIMIYDVLGDVVCGGFGLPMRKDVSDGIFIVITEEMMAIYAANNILKGIVNLNGNTPKVCGLILNKKDPNSKSSMALRFSKAVGIPIIATIPRSQEIAKNDMSADILSDSSSPVFVSINKIVEIISDLQNGNGELYTPYPLTEDGISNIMADKPLPIDSEYPKGACGLHIGSKNNLQCAMRSVSFAISQISDAQIVIHGPASCGYMADMMHNNHNLQEIRVSPLIEKKIGNNIHCTNIDSMSATFGATDLLEKKIYNLISKGHKTIFVLTTCLSIMIGDDVRRIVSKLSSKHPDVHIEFIKTDGKMDIDITSLYKKVYDIVIDMVKISEIGVNGAVNIVDRSFYPCNRGWCQKDIEILLGIFGFHLEKKLFNNIDLNATTLSKSDVNILLNDSRIDQAMKLKMESKGLKFFPLEIPKGFESTVEWIKEMGKFTNNEEIARKYISDITEEYKIIFEKAKKEIPGKSFLVVLPPERESLWMIDVLKSIDAKKIVIAYPNLDDDDIKVYGESQIVIRDFKRKKIWDYVNEYEIDMMLGLYEYGQRDDVPCVSMRIDRLGHHASINLLSNILAASKLPIKDGWRLDGDW